MREFDQKLPIGSLDNSPDNRLTQLQQDLHQKQWPHSPSVKWYIKILEFEQCASTTQCVQKILTEWQTVATLIRLVQILKTLRLAETNSTFTHQGPAQGTIWEKVSLIWLISPYLSFSLFSIRYTFWSFPLPRALFIFFFFLMFSFLPLLWLALILWFVFNVKVIFYSITMFMFFLHFLVQFSPFLFFFSLIQFFHILVIIRLVIYTCFRILTGSWVILCRLIFSSNICWPILGCRRLQMRKKSKMIQVFLLN